MQEKLAAPPQLGNEAKKRASARGKLETTFYVVRNNMRIRLSHDVLRRHEKCVLYVACNIAPSCSQAIAQRITNHLQFGVLYNYIIMVMPRRCTTYSSCATAS